MSTVLLWALETDEYTVKLLNWTSNRLQQQMCRTLQHESAFEVKLKRSSSVPDFEELNLDGHYSNQISFPWTHLFFMNFHPHPLLQTFCRENLWIWMNFLECMCVCVCVLYVYVCVMSGKTAMTFSIICTQTDSSYLCKMLFICPWCTALVNTNPNQAVNKNISLNTRSSPGHVASQCALSDKQQTARRGC